MLEKLFGATVLTTFYINGAGMVSIRFFIYIVWVKVQWKAGSPTEPLFVYQSEGCTWLFVYSTVSRAGTYTIEIFMEAVEKVLCWGIMYLPNPQMSTCKLRQQSLPPNPHPIPTTISITYAFNSYFMLKWGPMVTSMFRSFWTLSNQQVQ